MRALLWSHIFEERIDKSNTQYKYFKVYLNGPVMLIHAKVLSTDFTFYLNQQNNAFLLSFPAIIPEMRIFYKYLDIMFQFYSIDDDV